MLNLRTEQPRRHQAAGLLAIGLRATRSLAALLVLAACAGNGVIAPVAEPARFTIRLTSVPAATPDSATIHVAGTFNNWNPGAPEYRLTRGADGAYGIVLPDSVSGPVEFKFTLGSWERVETSASGGDVPNRTFTVPDSGATWIGSVAGWREPGSGPPKRSTASASVSILSNSFEIPQLGRTRRVWLYLPPDYTTSDKRYPVLYMHDGQNVFDQATSFAGEWGVDETLDSLHAAGEPVAIVVAVDNGQQRRLDEYSPWVHPRYGGGEGDEYVAFLAQTLKPYIDAHYRTLPDRTNTGIAGSSMGGLISLYAALEYPEVFGRAGIFSPAFWFARQVYDYARQATPLAPPPRFYIVSGALETATGEPTGVYARDQQLMVDTLAAAGFHDVVSLVRPDGTHSEWFWRREFPAAYQWLFAQRE